MSLSSRRVIRATFVISTFLAILLAEVHGAKLLNKECELRPVVIPVPSSNHLDDQLFVEVHRCLGHTSGYQQNYRCVSTNSQNINMPGGMPGRSVLNHTACGMKCACEANGGCGGEQVHTVTCPTEMKWDPHRCSCVGLCEETEASRKHLHKEEISNGPWWWLFFGLHTQHYDTAVVVTSTSVEFTWRWWCEQLWKEWGRGEGGRLCEFVARCEGGRVWW